VGRPAPEERASGLTGLVYETVRGVTRIAGASADALFAFLGPMLVAAPDPRAPRHAEREAVLAALNGVLGDHLAATANPLAIKMSLRHAGRTLVLERFAMRSSLPQATPRLLVLLHGLCTNDLQWQRGGHDHGEALARELGYTPVHVHYNSGLSVSTNGRVLAQHMEHLFDTWPVPVQRLVMVGHSMGGLVARSAIHHGALAVRGGLRWPTRVADLVCLGTPHQGAPLERAGHGVDVLLAAAPYAAPLARLGKVRSAGINDLRHGNILSSPINATADSPGGDDEMPAAAQVGLPAGTRCYAIAGSLGAASASMKSKLLGDGLVPVPSALGQHESTERRLAFAAEYQAVVHGTGHLDLLSSAEVFGLMQQWLR
jgi:pimeloyl-ACP methyl ester carboxylesterase